MAHLQYIPGDPRLVDQLVYELKSKGIFDQFRKDCIADVDTRPAYQNLRQRVENSVSTFLSRQSWQPDLNKNQLREKLRKHILDGNYLEQGVERIVDQVVNPKVASIFIPQVEDLVYNYLGISRKKLSVAETSNEQKTVDLLPNDLEAVSPGSVNNDDKEDHMDIDEVPPQGTNIQNEQEKSKSDIKSNSNSLEEEKEKVDESQLSSISDLTPQESNFSIDKENIPFPPEEIVVENIPPPENSPPKVELDKIELPKDTSVDIPLPDEMSVDIPLPDEIAEKSKDQYFKAINTDDDDSSSDSSLRRNMSPLTPIRNYNNENSCDAQQAFENNSLDIKNEDKKEPSSFRFTIETKSSENSCDVPKTDKDKKDAEANLSYQFNNQVNINNFNTPTYEDSSNSHNLQIDYESDANSKVNIENKILEIEQNSEDSKKEKKEERKGTNKSSHRSRDSQKHSSSSRDKKSDLKQSSSRDSSRHDKSKPSKDDKSRSYDKEKSKEKGDKKDSKESSRHRSSHKSSHRDSKSHRSSSSSHRHSSKHSDDKKSSSSSSHKDKDKAFAREKSTKDKPRDSRCNSHRSDKDRKSSSSSNSKSKHDDKDKVKKNKKETDDHYSLSGRGNPNRRSTDRDSNDGSSSSKGSNNPPSSKSSQTKPDSKRSSKLDTTSTSGDSTSPSDKENIVFESGTQARELLKHKPIVRIEKNLETPVVSPPRLPFVPDVTLRKPKIAENFEEAKKVMKMRKFLEEEQRRMNQEAALLLEFQANVRPSLSQVYSNISGPELEFACITNSIENQESCIQNNEGLQIQHNVQDQQDSISESPENVYASNATDEMKLECDIREKEASITNNLDETHKADNILETEKHAAHESENEKKCQTKFFEVTIITEEVSESEETQNSDFIKQEAKADIIDEAKHIDVSKTEKELKYFAEHEKYDAELERAKYSKFFKNIYQLELSNKLYLINCDAYTENIFREASKEFGDFNIVNYHRNGHLKINNPKTVKNLSTEVTLPMDYDTNDSESVQSLSFNSPQKFECSFELSSDYNKKLEEMVSKTSRQEIMEIILGSAAEDSSNMPTIDYCTESNIDLVDDRAKRKYCDVDYTMNNNDHILKPNKMRKLSSDHISSTTQEVEEQQEHCILTNTRSKYLGRPGRVGLPKPRRTNLQSSPSSDKSVENYEQNTPTQTLNGKMKPRNKVQRYDTTDLYKPKLHYLSKRNNIT